MKCTKRVNLLLLTLIAGAVACGDAGLDGPDGSGGTPGSGGASGSGGSGAGGNDASADPFERGFGGAVIGEKGSKLTLRGPDGLEEEIGSEVLFGWITGAHLGGNYFQQLRIGTTFGTMELRMSFPGDAPPHGRIEGVHELWPRRILLENSADLSTIFVEVFFQMSDPPFDPLTNATGTIELRENINAAEETYAIAGEIDIEMVGDGGVYQISGFLWGRDVVPLGTL